MRYIVTEDSKSGYMFWEAFARLEFKQDYKVIAAGGNEGRFMAVAYKVLEKMEADDYILLAFDKASGLNAHALLNKLRKAAIETKVEERNITIRLTSGYSFEETLVCFLTTGRFDVDDWVIEVANIINDRIIKNSNWFEDLILREIIEEHDVKMNNREQCVTSILAKASDKKGCKNIYAGKKSIGACWIGDMNKANYNTECKRCSVECENLSSKVVAHRLKLRNRKRELI